MPTINSFPITTIQINGLPTDSSPALTDIIHVETAGGTDEQLPISGLQTLLQGTLVTGPGSAVSGNIPTYNGATGKIIQDSGILGTNIVQGPASAVSGDIPSFNGTGGKTLQDSGYNTANMFNGIQGALINGYISVSAAANALTVSIFNSVTGSAPTATNPVYIWINNSQKTITSALTMTIPQGTNNLMNAGSLELTGKEIDWFLYLAWNVTVGVYMVQSRIPFANLMSDFAAYTQTSVLEKAGWPSQVGTINATDPCCVIGRFAATVTFSTPNYNWTVPAFTAINLVQRPIYETRRLSWTAQWTGYASATLTGYTFSYWLKNNQLNIQILTSGSNNANATTATITMPFQVIDVNENFGNIIGNAVNSSAWSICTTGTSSGSNIIALYNAIFGGAWTSAVRRDFWINGSYFIQA